MAQRTTFSPQQLCYLEEKFVENQFPDVEQRQRIASHVNLTTHHIQVWFQNKRAKVRRKLKKMEIDKPKVLVPKPPPFWPQHLPFDSNLTELLSNSDTVDTAKLSSSSKQLLEKSKVTSFESTKSSNPQNTTSELESSSSGNISNACRFCVQSNCDLCTVPKTPAFSSMFPDSRYHPTQHSNLSSNGSAPPTDAFHMNSHQSMFFKESHSLSSAEAGPSTCSSKCWCYRTTLPINSSQRPPEYHEQLQLPWNNTANLKHGKSDQHLYNNSSLILLANCATLSTSGAPHTGLQHNHPMKVPQSKFLSTCGAQLPSLYRTGPVQEFETNQFPGAIPSTTNVLEAEDDSLTSTLQQFTAIVPGRLTSIQTPSYSEELASVNEKLSN